MWTNKIQSKINARFIPFTHCQILLFQNFTIAILEYVNIMNHCHPSSEITYIPESGFIVAVL